MVTMCGDNFSLAPPPPPHPRQYVSVSRTPGHTKHFQTIFLTQTVRLCDCPGLIFPSLINRQLQVCSLLCKCTSYVVSHPLKVLCCMYPIAQVREPFTIVGYLAQRVPLVEILKLKHPVEEHRLEDKATSATHRLEDEATSATHRLEDEATPATHLWTAWDICDGGLWHMLWWLYEVSPPPPPLPCAVSLGRAVWLPYSQGS